MAAADVDAVLAIESASFASPWSREQFLQELASDASFCLAACAAGGLVAGFVCLMFAADECTIMDIAVASDMRGQGVGRRLMEMTLAECRQRQSRFIHLEVRVSAAPAIALYRSFGFTEAGRRTRYYRDGEDALIMTRIISQ
jgi:ribosomal-protein-alanine N-acetyltransferase